MILDALAFPSTSGIEFFVLTRDSIQGTDVVNNQTTTPLLGEAFSSLVQVFFEFLDASSQVTCWIRFLRSWERIFTETNVYHLTGQQPSIMSWFWRKPETQEARAPKILPEVPHIPEAELTPSRSPPNDARTAPSRTRDEIADAELRTFLDQFKESPEQPTSTPNSQRQQRPPRPEPNGIDPYPSELSCRALFDAAYFCQLPGGQFVNVYRYGSLRNCSEAWSNFWFCMRTNRGFMTDEERRERVREYYRKKEDRLRGKGSSEDVWEARREKVEGAFSMDLAELERQEREKG